MLRLSNARGLFVAAPAVFFLLTSAASCSSSTTVSGGDENAPPPANALGSGLRIRDVGDPKNPSRPAPGSTVSCSAVSVVEIDSFDETHDGKSIGTIYLQDTGSQEPYSGIGTFGATFIPASLRVGPGDVLDVKGQYQENANIGAARFAPGQPLPQLFRPTATLRFEAPPVQPKVIRVEDLVNYATARQWLGMLVTVEDVTLGTLVEDAGRVSADLLPGNQANTPAVTNELFDLGVNAYPPQTHFRSITGVVTYFFSFHLAPRSAADLVQ